MARAADGAPAGIVEGRVAGDDPERPVAERRDVAGQEATVTPAADPSARRSALSTTNGTLAPASSRSSIPPERRRAGRRDSGDVRARPGHRVEHGQRPAVAGRVDRRAQMVGGAVEDAPCQLDRLPPAGQQVEVDLVGLGAGDRRRGGRRTASCRQALSSGGVREPGPEQGRDRGELLAVDAARPRPRAGPAWCRCRRRPCRCRSGSCPGSAATDGRPLGRQFRADRGRRSRAGSRRRTAARRSGRSSRGGSRSPTCSAGCSRCRPGAATLRVAATGFSTGNRWCTSASAASSVGAASIHQPAE